MRFLLRTFAALVCVMSLPASVVFTDFQSSTGLGCAALGAVINGPVACAAAFTPSANYIMTDAQVKVEITQNPIADGNFDLLLYSNSSGLPGSSLGTIGTGTTASSAFGIVTVNSAALSLTSGTEYWLVMAPHDANTQVFWSSGGSPVPPTAFNPGWPMNFWTTQSSSLQFQIDGTQPASTPEPATVGLVTVGMLFATLRKRLR